MKLSPKVYIPTLLALAACLALKLLTGNDEYLVAALVSLAAGGTGIAAPAATGKFGEPAVTQEEVETLATLPRVRRP